ncbi:MAG: DUF4355 domain-containing protein [Lachnospiraceae bacterium]|nr:DUF4355 domain-containing protein [Lachnospiraceae bacterium]
MEKETDQQVTGGAKTGEQAAEKPQEQATGQEPKLFTQEEVNSFIQARLTQMKKQASKESNAEIEQRLADLTERENRLLVREELHKRQMPAELADIITGSDAADISAKLDKLAKIYGKAGDQPEEKGRYTGGFQIGGNSDIAGEKKKDRVREAFGL